MELTQSQLSIPGPRRDRNEDFVAFWHPPTAEEQRSRGSVLIIADGVGGQGDGDIASRLAVETALATFTKAAPDTAPATLLGEIFNAANTAVHDAAMARRQTGKHMATTLTVSIFRDDRMIVGHVGDCRVYVVQGGRLRRITNDHSYAGVQLRLGLITVQEAANSELRSVLTRCVGQEPFIRADYHTVTVHTGDIVLQCCDGLYTTLNEGEIYDIVTHHQPQEACRELVAFAQRRQAADDLSAQVLRIDAMERVWYYRGTPVYYPKAPKDMSQELQVGQILDGRFQLEEIISTSGMATIFKATDTKDKRTVAIKVPLLRFESNPATYTRFEREEQIGSSLHHPYIVRVEAIDPAARSRPYLVMEYLEGQTLGHLMRAVKPVPTSDALRIAALMCDALHYMHAHEVVHRDLKPDNVMICTDGNLRVMDFGIAKLEGSRRVTFGGFQPAMGTPDYMAPEQVRGKRGDARTDIYSLGAILYEMVTGRPPFEGDNPLLIMNARLRGDPIAPRKHNPELSEQVEEIILHAMARDAGERYPSARAMKNDLDHPREVKLTGRAARLQPVVAWRSRWRSRRLVMAGLVAIPLVIWLVVYLARHVHISVK